MEGWGGVGVGGRGQPIRCRDLPHLSISSVVTPTATARVAQSITSRATRPAARIPSMSFSDLTSICHGSIGPFVSRRDFGAGHG